MWTPTDRSSSDARSTMRTLLIAAAVAQSHGEQIRIDESLALGVGVVVVGLLLLVAAQAIAARRRVRVLEQSFARRVQDFLTGEKDQVRAEQLAIARREGQVALADWKAREEEAIRQDAIKRSQSVIVGKVTEHVVPFLPEFPWNPKDARFIGTPIDFVVFDGLDAGQLRQIVFVEVKTASSVLTNREKQIREAIAAGRLAWREMRIDHPVPPPLPTCAAASQRPASTLARGFFK